MDLRTFPAVDLKPGDVIAYGRDWLEVFDAQPAGFAHAELRLRGTDGEVRSFRVLADSTWVAR